MTDIIPGRRERTNFIVINLIKHDKREGIHCNSIGNIFNSVARNLKPTIMLFHKAILFLPNAI